MNKIEKTALLTGIGRREAAGFAKAGLFGLVALVLGFLGACCKHCKQAADLAPAPAKPQQAAGFEVPSDSDVQAIKKLVDTLDTSTGTAKPQDSCGPYPGYPCGTRYFTVSRGDFPSLS